VHIEQIGAAIIVLVAIWLAVTIWHQWSLRRLSARQVEAQEAANRVHAEYQAKQTNLQAGYVDVQAHHMQRVEERLGRVAVLLEEIALHLRDKPHS
jgi:hypothetical protein